MNREIHLRARLAMVLIACASCSDALEPASVTLGRYELVEVNAKALPVAGPCGGFIIQSSVLTLGAGRAAALERHETAQGTGASLTFVAIGTFRATRDEIIVELTGRWSHQQLEGPVRLALTRNSGQLRHQSEAPCDGSVVEVYELVAPL